MNIKILLYEWLLTAETKRDEALQVAFEKARKDPRNMSVVFDFFCEVVRHNEFKNIQAVLYELLK